MTDHFALLEEPRRPWPDLDALQARFLKLSSTVHPDRVHGAPAPEREAATRHYAELNVAHASLRETKTRLLHLLELESGRRPSGIEPPPADALEHFMAVSRVCREIDQFKIERDGVSSPMLKVKLFQRGLALTEEVTRLQQVVRGRLSEIEAELQALNAAWESAPPVGHPDRATQLPLARLEDLARSLSFLARGLAQLQERLVQLAT